MFEKQRKPFPPKPEVSRDTQVLRSISAQSAVSLDQNQGEQLMMRQLLLSIELDRKDTIIRELLELVEGDDSRRVIEELNIKCSRYELEVKSLRETISMLKENISSIESAKNNQMFTSMSQFNEELEQKVSHLEAKLRKVQEQKIDLEEELNKNKMKQTMEGYKSFQNENNEKNRVRELETQLAAERARNQTEKKTIYQKNVLLDELKSKIIDYENRQKLIVSQYEEKIRTFHSEMMFHENLKKSQINSTEDRINTLNQQLSIYVQEIKHLKITNQQLRDTIQVKERELNKVTTEFRTVESNLIRTENHFKEVSSRLESVTMELKSKEKQSHDKSAIAQRLSTQIEEMKFMFTTKGEEANLYSAQLQRLRADNIELESQIKNQNLEIRRLKKKPPVLCQGCQAREMGSSSYISSQKSIKSLNIGEIIQQTEQLFISNKRMESMINRRDSLMESSIHLYPPHRTIDL